MNDFPFIPYEGNEPYVFVSYSRKDKQKVLPILRTLSKFDFRIWYDSGIEPTEYWPDYAATRLNDCTVCMVFHSKNSVASHECQDEIHHARTKGKIIFQIYLEETNLPPGLEMRLGARQAEFFYKYDKNELNKFYERIVSVKNLQVCRKEKKSTVATKNLELALKYHADKKFFEAAKIFDAEAEVGNSNAMLYLGVMYLEGEISCGEPQPEEGLRLLEQAVNLENDVAMNYLAVLYQKGNFVEKDLNRAVKLFSEAIKRGNPQSMYNLGEIYCDSENPRDFDKGVRLLYSSAEKGNDHAMYRLGSMYCDDEIAGNNYAEGIRLLQMAANCGNSNAMNKLGIIHYNGNIIKKNLTRAANFFFESAKRDNDWGMYNLAWMCCDGEIPGKNYVDGIKILHDAANLGNAWALHDLSKLYAKGKWVPKNTSHAKNLENMAIQNGYTPPEKKKSFLKRLFGLS